MIIAGVTKVLAAAVHSQSGSAQVATGTMYCVARLELAGDADDGKYWDTTAGGSWQASPSAWPEATHTQAGVWAYALPSGASTGKAGGTIHYTMTNNLTEASATTVCGGGEHRVNAEDPLATTDIPAAGPNAATIADAVWDEDTGDHVGEGSAGQQLNIAAAGGDPAAIADAVWDEAIAGHLTGGTTGASLNSASPSAGSSMVTITVQTGAGVPVPGVAVSIYDATNTALQLTATTDTSGQIVCALNDATYKDRLVKAGHTFAAPVTMVVSGTTSITITATAWAPSAPTSADLCVVYGYLTDCGAAIHQGTIVSAWTVTPLATGGRQLTDEVRSTTTSALGYFELSLVRGSVVRLVCREAGLDKTLTVPAAASQDVTSWS